jgi:hypothetical protein
MHRIIFFKTSINEVLNEFAMFDVLAVHYFDQRFSTVNFYLINFLKKKKISFRLVSEKQKMTSVFSMLNVLLVHTC